MPALDAVYIARMEALLALYEKPYDPREPVVCWDEKPVALHADVRPAKAVRPGRLARCDSEYRRCGTANIFCAVEPLAGRHFAWPTPARSGAEFARAVERLLARYRPARRLHLVVDNLNIHGRKALTDHFGEQRGGALWERLRLPYTPKHGSWLNQAEIEISLLVRQCLGQRRIPTLALLRSECRAWLRSINRRRTMIPWRFTPRDARRIFHYQPNLFSRSEN